MPAKPALEPVFNKSRKRWRVDVPASMSDTGKRIRVHFKTRDSAREYIDRIEGKEAPDKAIDPRLAQDSNTARERLESAGLQITLAEAIRELVEAREAIGGSGSLLEAALAYRAAHTARNASKLFVDAVTLYLALKETELREVTLKGYRYTLQTALTPLDNRTLADITAADLDALLGGLTPSTRKVHMRNLGAFWRWAAKPPREWCTTAPLEALEYTTKETEADTVVFKPAEARALLEAAEGYSPNAACAFALAIFGGIRSAELAGLCWSDLGEEHVEIGASIAKKGKRRLVPICPALAAWIEAYRPADADPEDFIVGANWVEVSKLVRRRAGWNVVARLLAKPPKPTRGPWPKNVARHTCASILVATGEPLETLIFQFGHTGGHDLLRRHYVGRMTKKQALEILSIGPKGTKIKTIKAA
ncbi:tyrosine-type recombinase/integrase [Haloferula chungangensis]|uniref:Tyrosine-type recombinase/integrase n=1 Tax=Haloferula chungangensis TaxID=1048331 RepID=A0ABW2L351_9BACT